MNVASRLLDVASARGARIALSADLAAAMGRTPSGTLGDERQVTIRGRALPLAVLTWTPDPDPALPARRAGLYGLRPEPKWPKSDRLIGEDDVAKRVLVVGLGNMGMSHALAYARIRASRWWASAPAISKTGRCRRRSRSPAFHRFETALACAQARHRVDQHAAGHPAPTTPSGPWRRAPHVFVEKPLAETVARGREGGRDRAAHRPQAGDRLHPPPAPVLDQVHRDRAARSARRWSSA